MREGLRCPPSRRSDATREVVGTASLQGETSHRCGVGPRNQGGKSAALTALHLKFLVPPLQAVDLGLLVSKKLLKFVLDGLRQLVQLRALQDLLQHRRHVDWAVDRGGSGRRSRNGQERRRPRGPRSLGGRLGLLTRWLARARPPETPAAGPWEIELCVSRGTRRATAPALAKSAQPPEAVHPGNPSSEAASDPVLRAAIRLSLTRLSAQLQAARASGKRSFFQSLPSVLFRTTHSASFFHPRPPTLACAWTTPPRGGALVNPRSSPKSKATLPSKLRDAMGRPLWRFLDTEPLEGIGLGRAGQQALGHCHALNGAQKGAGWRPQ